VTTHDESSNRITLRNATVWTGSGPVRERHDIVIDSGLISGISATGKPVDRGVVIECDGRWVLPGLIDCHMHFFGARSPDPVYWSLDPPVRSALRAAADAERLLKSGLTTVRDAGSRVGVALQDAIEEGEVRGPRVFPAHLGISRTGGHGDVHSLPLEWVREHPFMALVVDGPDECRRAVRTIARSGARWVKIWATGGVLSERDDPRHSHLTPAELEVIVGEAHAVGLPVGAHCEGLEATKDCVAAGVDTIEHGFYLDEEVCRAMADRGIPLVSTLAFLHRTAENRGGEVPQYAIDKAQEILEDAVMSVRMAYELGVPIAMGTDTFAEPLTPFGLNTEELLYLHRAGVSPQDALRAATSVAAKVVGRADALGLIDVGRVADLVVLREGSPLDDLGTAVGAEQMALVIKAGRIVAGMQQGEVAS
jgi:imidazolonepropionase-like amidohydrolase